MSLFIGEFTLESACQADLKNFGDASGPNVVQNSKKE